MLSLLLKTITDTELEHIAALDYGQDAAEHLAALRTVIFDQDGNLQEGQYHFPYEVIQLGSHGLDPGHEREFFFCTILVLQAVLSGDDSVVNVRDMLDGNVNNYNLLPAELREEIVRAYKLFQA